MFCVYIIYSKKLDRFYIGTTSDYNLRIEQHNTGVYTDAFTIKGIPWEKFFLFENLNSEQAYQIEKHLKKMKSKTFIQNLVKYPELADKIVKKYQWNGSTPIAIGAGGGAKKQKRNDRFRSHSFFYSLTCRMFCVYIIYSKKLDP